MQRRKQPWFLNLNQGTLAITVYSALGLRQHRETWRTRHYERCSRRPRLAPSQKGSVVFLKDHHSCHTFHTRRSGPVSAVIRGAGAVGASTCATDSASNCDLLPLPPGVDNLEQMRCQHDHVPRLLRLDLDATVGCRDPVTPDGECHQCYPLGPLGRVVGKWPIP